MLDCVFIELIDVQKLEINFFLLCVSLSIMTIYIDYNLEEREDNYQLFSLGESLDESIQEFYTTYLNFKRFFEVFYKLIKSEIAIYQQTTANYSDYMTKIKVINGNNVYRQNKVSQLMYSPEDLKLQLDSELMKLNDCEEDIKRSHKVPTEVEMYIFLNDVSPQILQKSALTIKYQGSNLQKFVPVQYSQKGANKLLTTFKTRIPFLNTNKLYLESEGMETITFELIMQISYSFICFQGTLEWDPVQLLYNKRVVHLNQKNSTSSTIDMDKTLMISIYLEPIPPPFQQQIANQIQTTKYQQNRIKQDSILQHQPPIFVNEGTSLLIYKYDIQNQIIHNISTTIDPIRFSQNTFESSLPQNIQQSQFYQKQISKEAVNDWFAKISFLIANNPQQSIDEKLKLLYLTMKSAFGYEVSIKNVLLLYKEIARIQGVIIDFESLLLRASQIIGRKLKNSIGVSVNFMNGDGQRQSYLANYTKGNQLLEINTSTLEKEYYEVINQSFIEGVHIVDVRSIIGQVHKNLIFKSGIPSISDANLINKYYLSITIEGAQNTFLIDENGMIILTKKLQEQQILISKISIFQNIFVDQNMFLAIFTQSPFLLDYFCRYPQFQFFTRQIPLLVSVNFYDIQNQNLFKTEPINEFSLIDPISYIIEKIISLGIIQKPLNIEKIKCFFERQQLYLNDNLINQIDIKKLKQQMNSKLLICLDIYETDEMLIKLPYSEIAKSKIHQYSQIDFSSNIPSQYKDNQSLKNYLQFQAIVFSQKGISFENLYKLPMNDIYSTKKINFHISPHNLHLI